MTEQIPFIMQGDNLVLMINNQSFNINRESHANFDKILDAIREQDWDAVRELTDLVSALRNYVNGKLVIRNGVMFYNDREFHNALSTRIMEMFQQGFPIDAMIAFMDNLMSNPSRRAVEELYGFLEKNNLPITSDGHFLAYKRVRISTDVGEDGKFDEGDYVDCHTGKIRNNVGDVVAMQRNEVDDDSTNTCSDGLHFASLEYMPSFGGDGPIVILKIDPADVVAIPNDYNNQKGRTCKYEVVGEHGVDGTVDAFDAPVDDSYENDEQAE